MAADEASRFVRRAGIKVTSELLDQLESDVRAMAFEYMKRPPYAIFRQLAAVRSEVFGILDRHPRPEYIRDLYRIAGRASALLAHASNDLGHPDAADSHARTALLCADLSGDRRLATYILWVQSSISYWRGDYREAAGIAHAGRAMSTHPDDSMRLASQEARALAIIGKQDDAISALELVADVRGQVGVDVDRSGVGVFTFGAGKAAYYSSEARLALGGSANVRRAVLDASDSLELLRLASEDGGSVELLAAARLDLMMALLASSDLEGAAQEAALILSLPSESRTVPVVKRVAAVQRTLGDDEFAVQALAIDIREQMDIFCAYPAARELPSLGMARRGRGL